MMTDRELLELAAKAAGIKIYESTDGTIQNRPVWVFSAGGGMGTMPYEEQWNPLLDDGQALRVAVKLKLETEFGSNFVNVGSSHHDSEWHMARESDVDLYAATRRAIVRAGAQIGKNMK